MFEIKETEQINGGAYARAKRSTKKSRRKRRRTFTGFSMRIEHQSSEPC